MWVTLDLTCSFVEFHFHLIIVSLQKDIHKHMCYRSKVYVENITSEIYFTVYPGQSFMRCEICINVAKECASFRE